MNSSEFEEIQRLTGQIGELQVVSKIGNFLVCGTRCGLQAHTHRGYVTPEADVVTSGSEVPALTDPVIHGERPHAAE